ncbi:hypothetical protein BGX23_002878 [Mortierella sp. AD031]|nr:hypothetical protein BGX23_002878 [Mortierella sp. AD031]KAG0197677.1 hypothetical protein BGX33_000404 [Mortierella sp. NVP41]
MLHLPNEIVFAIGQCLDASSLFNSRLVCSQWSVALGPLLWFRISKKAWHHPRFPIKHDSAIYDASLNHCLSHVKFFEWHNNLSLTSKKVLTKTQPQIPTTRLAILLSMAPNLTVLSLRMESHGPDSSLFEAVRGLQHLKILKIDMPERDDLVPIETMFPLFARLDELRLEGYWYQREVDPQLPLLADEPLWRIKRLTIDLLDMPLLRRCPDLEHLRLLPPTLSLKGKMRAVWDTLALLLLESTSLKGLIFYSLSKKRCYCFKVQDPRRVNTLKPHRMLDTKGRRYWSTEEVVALL